MALSSKNQDSPTENPHPFPHPLFLPVPDPHLSFLGKESPPGEKTGGAELDSRNLTYYTWPESSYRTVQRKVPWAGGKMPRDCSPPTGVWCSSLFPASPPFPAAQIPVGKICPTSLLVKLLPILDLFSKRKQLVSQSFQMATCRSPASKAHLPGITRMSRQRWSDGTGSPGPPTSYFNWSPFAFILHFNVL